MDLMNNLNHLNFLANFVLLSNFVIRTILINFATLANFMAFLEIDLVGLKVCDLVTFSNTCLQKFAWRYFTCLLNVKNETLPNLKWKKFSILEFHILVNRFLRALIILDWFNALWFRKLGENWLKMS